MRFDEGHTLQILVLTSSALRITWPPPKKSFFLALSMMNKPDDLPSIFWRIGLEPVGDSSLFRDCITSPIDNVVRLVSFVCAL